MNESDRFELIAEIFNQVRALPAGERSARIDKLCSEDRCLAEEVLALLDEHDKASPLDDHITGSMPNFDELIADETPVIDRIELADKLGEGGMGVVYEGKLHDPPRAVAVKVIKRGMDSQQVLARFDLERRALARMEHPNIASVIDAGLTQNGQPYFAMELVRGDSIIHHCETHQLNTDDRLALFLSVCSAIQHAHQKGIIHRDIKPSNVLMSQTDERAVPKVIDFGIAKAIDPEQSIEITSLLHKRAIGTPAYMSPEQADPIESSIDTRTDIYSLGVLLYELLTGSTPFIDSELRSKGYSDMIRIITEQDPPKPSDRVSTMQTSISSYTPQQLRGMLKGDLDWIVMKCLEKDPSRRYETVSGLIEDINRAMRNEPVNARPPSRAYKLHKFVQRNRGRVIAGCVILSVLLLGIAGTSIGMIWALNEREMAQLAAADELAAQVVATNAAERAASEAEAAEELSHFFIMDVLSAADPARAVDRELTVREALINASENIEGRFTERPDVESRIHNALGYLFGRLGSPELAEAHHMREWQLAKQTNGSFSIESARMMHSVIGSLARQGRDKEAIELTRHQIEVIDQLSTPEAEQLRPRAIGNLGALLVRTGRLSEAAPILEDTLQLKRAMYGDRHATTLSTINNLALIYSKTDLPDRALPLAVEAYKGRFEVLGESDPRTLVSLINLARTHARLGDYAIAIELFRDGNNVAEERLDSDHPTALDLKLSYTETLLESGNLSSAEQTARSIIQTLEGAVALIETKRGALAQSYLASSLLKQGLPAEALILAESALHSARAVHRPGSPHLSEYLLLYSQILIELSHFDIAEHTLLNAWESIDHQSVADAETSRLIDMILKLYENWDASSEHETRREQIELWRSRLNHGSESTAEN